MKKRLNTRAGEGWAAHLKSMKLAPRRGMHPAWREYFGDSQFISPSQEYRDRVKADWEALTPEEAEAKRRRLNVFYYGNEEGFL